MISVEERLSQLEIRYTYLEDAFQALNATVIEKDRVIGNLKLKLASMEQAVSQYIDIRSDERPPHY